MEVLCLLQTYWICNEICNSTCNDSAFIDNVSNIITKNKSD